eukprot:SAG31_NODE_4419_length_3250_cov_2.345922_3_plen_165_part_00
MKTYEKMNGFTEVFAKKNYLRVVEKSPTYGYTLYPVVQTILKKEPKKVYCGVSRDGIKLFRTDGLRQQLPVFSCAVIPSLTIALLLLTADKAVIAGQPDLTFANLQSWSCVPGSTCSISLTKSKAVFQTEIGADICALLKSYALVIVQRRQRAERAAKAKAAKA